MRCSQCWHNGIHRLRIIVASPHRGCSGVCKQCLAHHHSRQTGGQPATSALRHSPAGKPAFNQQGTPTVVPSHSLLTERLVPVHCPLCQPPCLRHQCSVHQGQGGGGRGEGGGREGGRRGGGGVCYHIHSHNSLLLSSWSSNTQHTT